MDQVKNEIIDAVRLGDKHFCRFCWVLGMPDRSISVFFFLVNMTIMSVG